MTESNGPITKQPTTKTRKPNKVATKRLWDAVDDIMEGAGLNPESSIADLYDAFEKEIVRQVRGL